MTTTVRPSLTVYLLRESVWRWLGRPSVPLARIAVAGGLALAALLVLGSFALGASVLERRIAEFGLDALVIRTPLQRGSDPAPVFPKLREFGRTLTLKLPAATVRVDSGNQVPLAIAAESTLAELRNLGVRADRLPVLLSSSLPAGMPVRASLGPWTIEAETVQPTAALRPLGAAELLIARPEDFPFQAALPGSAVTLLARAPTAPPLEGIVAALNITFSNNPPTRGGSPNIQSALPLLRELTGIQQTWRGYAALLGAVLAAMIAVVFGSGAILEFEATSYATALLRSFGVGARRIWLQRLLEAMVLANAGTALGFGAALAVCRLALPSVEPHLLVNGVLLPVVVAINLGALAAALPVAIALRKPVGLVLP